MSTKDELLVRLQYAIMRLQEHADRTAAAGLTDPDEPSGERWEWGQVWAHLAEFVPYWMGQFRGVLAAQADRPDEPAPFGRIKTDAGRVAAIEHDRATPVDELWKRMLAQFADLWNYLDDLPDEAWTRQGIHPTLGVMTMPDMVERFVVGHLEEHAAQLDGLARGEPNASPPASA